MIINELTSSTMRKSCSAKLGTIKWRKWLKSSVSIVRTSKQLFLFFNHYKHNNPDFCSLFKYKEKTNQNILFGPVSKFPSKFLLGLFYFFLSALSDRTRVACHYNILNATSVRGLLDDYHCAPELNNRVSTLVVNCHPVHHSSGNTEGADDLSSFKFIWHTLTAHE